MPFLAISSSVDCAQLLAVERDRHVVQLGRLEQPVDVVGVAEDRRADLGVVAADALEDAGAVVQAVREYVDLGVLPCDELAVHPDEVRWLHVRVSCGQRCASTACVASAVLAVPPRSAGAQPLVKGLVHRRFYGRGRVGQIESVAQHHRGAEEHRQRVGDPLAGDVGRRAVDGLEDAGRAVLAEADALGSMPIEPVSIAASSLRMSPNMFSVRITSKWRGDATSFIAALSTSTCSSSTFGNSLGVHVA